MFMLIELSFLYLIWKELRRDVKSSAPITPIVDNEEFTDEELEQEPEELLETYVSQHIMERRASNALLMEELKSKINGYGSYDEPQEGLYNIPHEDLDLEIKVKKVSEEEYAI